MFESKKNHFIFFLFLSIFWTSSYSVYAKPLLCTVLKDVLERNPSAYQLSKLLDKSIAEKLTDVDKVRLKELLAALSFDEKLKIISDFINKSSTVFTKQNLISLLKKYPPNKHDEVLEAFYDLTLYSTMDDIHIVANYLTKKFPILYVGDPISGKLGAFNYLSKKSMFFQNNVFFNRKKMDLASFLSVPNNSSILVDQTILDILNKNPQALEHVKKADLKLVFLNGLEESIDYSDSANFLSLKQKIDSRLASKTTGPDFQTTIDVRDQLEKLGISDRLSTVYYNKTSLEKTVSLTPPNALAQKHLGYSYLTSRLKRNYFKSPRLLDELLLTPKENYEKIIDVILSSGSFKSLQNMAQDSQRLKVLIEQGAESLGKSKSDIIYLHPDYFKEVKSMSLVSHLYKSSNNLPEGSFISYMDILKNPKIADGKVVVILDDFIGSGDSMESFCTSVIHSLPKSSSVIAASFYGTRNGIDKLKDFARGIKKKYNEDLRIITLQIAPTYKESIMAVKELDNYGKGYGGANTLFSMEYMSPDNNNQMMAPFAKTYTFERTSAKLWSK